MSGTDTRPGGWAVVARQEATDLWVGAKGWSVLFGVSVLLALLAYLAAADAGINLLDARESVGLVTQVTIGLGTLAALVVSADAISGERERGTLEALLVTPVSRRDIVIGKLVAATTMWVASWLVALPFVIALAQGPGLAAMAIVVVTVAGSLVAAALTAVGLAISAVSMSNRTSLAASVAVLLLLTAPSQLPAVKANGTLSSVLITANPVSAGLSLADRVLVKQQPWADQLPFVVAPALAAVVFTTVAVLLSRRLELGGAR